MDENSKVYILLDGKKIVCCEGGYTMQNIKDIEKWTLIDEGVGDRYNLCQSNYFEKPLTDDRGIYRFKYIDGEIIERSQEEMDADAAEMPIPAPSLEETVEELRAQNEMLTECILELSELLYN